MHIRKFLIVLVLILIPASFAFSVTRDLAFITNEFSDTVSVIDIASNIVIKTIPVGDGPFSIGVSPDGNYAYVGNRAGESISVISVSGLRVVDTIPLGATARGVAVSPDSSRIYVATSNPSNLKIIQASDNSVIGDFPILSNPQAITVHPSGQFVYISEAAFAGAVTVFNTSDNSIVSIPTSGQNPRGLAITPDGSRLYAAISFTRDVDIIDTNTNTVINTIQDVTPRQSLFCSTISPDGETLYIANAPNGNELTVIRLSDNNVTSVPMNGDTISVDVTPDSDFAYVTGSDANQVFVVNALQNIVVDNVPVGFSPASCGKFITRQQLSPVPTLSEWGLIAMVGILGLAGLIAVRRRQINI